MSGCGSKKLRKAVDATARLAAQVNNLQVQIEKSYDENLISADTARRATLVVKNQLNPAVKAYTDFIEELRRTYPPDSETKPSGADWAKVRSLFNAVSLAFTQVVNIFKVLTPAQNVYVEIAIIAIREGLDTIAGLISEADTKIRGGEQWRILQTS